MRYLETPAGYVVWGTGSGSRRDPDWFQNLRQVPTAQVQVREREFTVSPRELHGEEREAMWRDTILAKAPEVSKYAQKAGRTIPVAVLDRSRPRDSSRGATVGRPPSSPSTLSSRRMDWVPPRFPRRLVNHFMAFGELTGFERAR